LLENSLVVFNRWLVLGTEIMVIGELGGRTPFWFLKGNIKVLVICKVIWSFSTSIVYPFFSLYILALGGTPTQIGLINSLGVLASMALYPVGGYIADRMGRVKLVGYATLLYSLSHILFIFARDWKAVALGQFLSHIFLFYSPALNALRADSLPPGVRGRGFATMMAVPSAIRIVAPYVGGWIIESYGGGDLGMVRAIRLFWGVNLFAGILVATIRLRFLKETLKEDEVGNKLSLRELPFIIKESYKSIIESLRWMDASLRGIVVIEVIASLFVSMSSPFWIVYAKQVIGLTPYDWGTVLLVAGLLGIVLAIPLGSMVDIFGPRALILFALAFSPPTIFLYLYAEGFLGVLAILCIMSIINDILVPAFSTLIANIIPRSRRGRLYSLIGERGIMLSFGNFWGGGFLLFPAAAFGSLIGGFVYDINKTYPWIILSIASLAIFFLTNRYIKEPANAQS
jgi:MFS family permease